MDASFCCSIELKHPGCAGRCSCITDVNWDPSKLSADSGVQPYANIIVLLQSLLPRAKIANPSEGRRMFTMGLPSQGGHAGQILFESADSFLSLMMGDCSNRDDPCNFAQNKRSSLGKILRLDIDNIPSATEIIGKGLLGHYYIPTDNPFADEKEVEPEIWALGFRNPWRYAAWAGTEAPEYSGNFSTAKISFRRAHDSPVQCNSIGAAGNSSYAPALGYIFSFAEDSKKDVYVLTSCGVYRVGRPSRCNFICGKEHAVNSVTHGQRSCSPYVCIIIVLIRVDILLLLLLININSNIKRVSFAQQLCCSLVTEMSYIRVVETIYLQRVRLRIIDVLSTEE
ncbi:hypothetical protein C1H46_025496 [Malus baccata]|uniref:Glucose/Sorbosone dehydrogenase domain-containing protein n=1 Tax=Malus baccata TaxID=106549 RepID=A0A540LQX8_MALBA|nr:hypothetical protein C1H46_025496 [Malus baccata]